MTEDLLQDQSAPAGGGSVGAELAAARERQGLTVMDVSRQLRLAVRQVEALESDEFDKLPGPTFVRGFIRNYARLARIDPQPLLDTYQATLPQGPTTVVSPPTQGVALKPDVSVRGTTPWRRYGLVLVLILAAGGAALALGVLKRGEDADRKAAKSAPSTTAPAATAPAPGEPAAVTLPGQPPVPAPPGAPATPEAAPAAPAATPAVGAPVPAPPSAPVQAPPAATGPAASVPPAPQPAQPAVPLPPPPASAAPSAPVPSAPAPTAPVPPPPRAAAPVAPAPAAFTSASASAANAAALPLATPADNTGASLRLTFNGESWVEVRDGTGKRVFSRLNQPGSEQTVRGKPPFSLTVGNAPNVSLYYNGQSVDLAPHTRADVARLRLQ